MTVSSTTVWWTNKSDWTVSIKYCTTSTLQLRHRSDVLYGDVNVVSVRNHHKTNEAETLTCFMIHKNSPHSRHQRSNMSPRWSWPYSDHGCSSPQIFENCCFICYIIPWTASGDGSFIFAIESNSRGSRIDCRRVSKQNHYLPLQIFHIRLFSVVRCFCSSNPYQSLWPLNQPLLPHGQSNLAQKVSFLTPNRTPWLTTFPF